MYSPLATLKSEQGLSNQYFTHYPDACNVSVSILLSYVDYFKGLQAKAGHR
jgi:hypothetical protein